MRCSFVLAVVLLSGWSFPNSVLAADDNEAIRTETGVVSTSVSSDQLILRHLKEIEEQNVVIQRQNRYLLQRLSHLEGKIESLEAATEHETLGVGLGLMSGLKEASGTHRLVLEANFRYVFAGYIPKTGVYAGLTTDLRIWNVRWHWLGVGVMYYGGNRALSVPEFRRSADLLLTSGVDVRIWKGLELRAQVAWFIPPPGPILDKAKERLDDAIDDIDFRDSVPTGTTPVPGPILDEGKDRLDNAIDDAKRDLKSVQRATRESWGVVTGAYGRAFRSPYFTLGLRWEF